jgi:hypothetical protein
MSAEYGGGTDIEGRIHRNPVNAAAMKPDVSSVTEG